MKNRLNQGITQIENLITTKPKIFFTLNEYLSFKKKYLQ